jgi:hypothetical protein
VEGVEVSPVFLAYRLHAVRGRLALFHTDFVSLEAVATPALSSSRLMLRHTGSIAFSINAGGKADVKPPYWGWKASE